MLTLRAIFLSVIIAEQMKKQYLTYLISGIVTASLVSCGGEPEKPEIPQPENVETLSPAEPSQTWGFSSEGGNTYTVPSPNELFSIIKQSNLGYMDGLISTEAVNYSSSKAQALNFGRITADIAYTASYEKFQESITNFDNLRKIGDDLGISYVFDEMMVSRVTDNMDNPDSLEVISTDSYQAIIAMLEQNEKGSTLAIIAAGGFVESVYILTSLIDEYSDDNELIQRLADQKLVMENVLDYLNLYAEETRVQEVMTEMESVSDVFLNLDEEKVSADMATDNDKVVLGGSRILMSAEEFNELKAAAANYRNEFSNPSQS